MLLTAFPVSALPRSRSSDLYFVFPVRHFKNKRPNVFCRLRLFLRHESTLRSLKELRGMLGSISAALEQPLTPSCKKDSH